MGEVIQGFTEARQAQLTKEAKRKEELAARKANNERILARHSYNHKPPRA